MNIIEKLILESPTFDIDSRPIFSTKPRKKLKDMSVDQVSPNIVIVGPTENQTIMYPKGFFLMYFFENEEYANDMKNDKKDYLIVPRGGPRFSGQTNFQRIWRKPQAEGIIGMIQGEISSEDDEDDYIFIDFMTVRSKVRRSSITTKMIDLLKQKFPNRKLESSERTKQGESFWKKYNK